MDWDSLLAPPPAEDRAVDEVDKLYAQVFSNSAGQKLLRHLRAVTIEQPTWYPGEDASHGYAREGQNSLVREIERRISRARTPND
ncbi:MAG: Bbp19 family protein [Alphaproteobacteria bacterium]|jgi:hypothetical protein|tara:strand:+ start:814 stop:1068 length:255 start_codon:yes stop_codon:yes gene_type:complete